MPERKLRKRGDYRVEVFRASELMAWTEFIVGPQRTECDTYVEPSPQIVLAVYDLLLLMALNLCPFPSEEKWLKAREAEHARISVEDFVRDYQRRHRNKPDNGTDIPW